MKSETMSPKHFLEVNYVASIIIDFAEYDDNFFQYLSEKYDIEVKLSYTGFCTKVIVIFIFVEAQNYAFKYDLDDIMFGAGRLQYTRSQKFKELKQS